MKEKSHIPTQTENKKQNSFFFQPKLSINQPNDVYEQEADAVADKVMRMKEPSSERKFFAPPVIQRKCADCEEEEKEQKLQKKGADENNVIIQREDDKEEQQQPAQSPALLPPLRLTPPFDSVDYLGLQQTFFNRGVMFPGGYMDGAQQEWGRQYQLYSQFGLGNLVGRSFMGDTLKFFGVTPPGGDWNAWLANTTTPLAVDSALSHDFPNFNEQEERRGGLPAPTIINAPAIHFKKEKGHENDVTESIDTANTKATVQRKCAHCDEEEKKIQRKESGSESTTPVSNTESYLNALSGGSPLRSDEKNFFESRMGYDFSGVRIHNDSSANVSAKSVNALAYTHGNNIVFGTGQYQPGTNEGKKLLAHELTHTVQQGSVMRKVNNSSQDIQIQKKCVACEEENKLQRKETSMMSQIADVEIQTPATKTLQNKIIMRLCGDADCGASDPATPPCPESDIFFTNRIFNDIRFSVFISSSHPFSLRRGATNDAVVLVQEFLLNFLCSGINRNGIRAEMADRHYGRFTAQAVRIFQSTHIDSNGIPLVTDGEVGPGTLNAMDIAMELPPVNLPLAPEGRGECFGRAEHGPGLKRDLNIQRGDMPLIIPFIPAMKAWELLNFDIDKHFVKTEHRNFLRSDIIPAFNTARTAAPTANVQVKIIGEASTTASDEHNQTLSENRANCVVSTLIALGVPASSVVVNTGRGEELARDRLIARGAPSFDNVEDLSERKVTIVLFSPAVDDHDCDKTKPSQNFVMKIACQGPHAFFVNIGDMSDLSQPTYREFTWLLDGSLTGCNYVLDVGPEVMLPVNVLTDLHLAINNPDDFFAPSEFRGNVNLHTNPGSALLSRNSPVGILYNALLPGSWNNITCGTTFQDLPGHIIPRGPAHCGIVPNPPEAANCEERTGPCSPADRRQETTRFEGRLVRLSGDPLEILRRIPGTRQVMEVVDEILNQFGRQALAGGAFVTLASTNLATPIRRNFVFIGAGLTTPSSSIIEVSLTFAEEFTLDNPKKLETDAASTFSAGSDFEGSATLTIKGQSNHTELAVTGNGVNKTIVFKGLFCNSGGDRTASGRLLPVTETECDTLFVPWMPERNCDEDADGCPPARKTESGRRFQIKTGRATYSSLPAVGKKIADSVGGCGATLAFMNIGTDTGSGNWIHRKFLLVARNTGCAFWVNRDSFFVDFTVPRFLAMMDGDDPFDLSHFIGPAAVNNIGNLHITNIPSADFRLPGNFMPDAATCSTAHADGAVIPVSAVECGEVPQPFHLTTPDPSDIDRCRQFRDDNLFVQSEIAALNSGLYDDIISTITNPPALRYPHYRDLFRMIGMRVYNGVFPGQAADGSSVITIVDFKVLSVTRDPVMGYLFNVQILSDPCTYNAAGQPVFLRERGCREGFIINGQNSVIFPVLPFRDQDTHQATDPNTRTAGDDRDVQEVRGPGGIVR